MKILITTIPVTYKSLFKRQYFFLILLSVFLLFQSCKPAGKFSYQARKERLLKKNEAKYARSSSSQNSTEKDSEDTEIEENEISTSNSVYYKQQKIIKTAEGYVGTPHQIGGLSKKGIDCSGLTTVSYESVGVSLPRTASGQALMGKPVSINELQKGDLLFFNISSGSKITHVGIVYEVKGKEDIEFIHASTSAGVRKDNLFSEYWIKYYKKARRILEDE
jgi:cell wall-associated NlpC family hydrolase